MTASHLCSAVHMPSILSQQLCQLPAACPKCSHSTPADERLLLLALAVTLLGRANKYNNADFRYKEEKRGA
eukprot:124676-Rhodomonas_salina.3